MGAGEQSSHDRLFAVIMELSAVGGCGDEAMTGNRLVIQENLFYHFRLEDHVPSTTCCGRLTVSLIGRFRRHLAPFYSASGRPLIDPDLMIRMLTAAASARSGSCAKRCISIWRIGGFAVLAWRAKCLITRPSQRTTMSDFH